MLFSSELLPSLLRRQTNKQTDEGIRGRNVLCDSGSQVYVSPYVRGFPIVSACLAVAIFRICYFQDVTLTLEIATVRFTRTLGRRSTFKLASPDSQSDIIIEGLSRRLFKLQLAFHTVEARRRVYTWDAISVWETNSPDVLHSSHENTNNSHPLAVYPNISW
jgi:hypothetical protein